MTDLTVPVSQPCGKCDGTGKQDESECPTCKGSGRVTEHVGLYELSVLIRGAVTEKRGH